MELKQLTEQFESALGEIKGLLDTQNAEIAKTGEVSEKTATAIAEVEGRISEYAGEIKALGGRLDDMEVKLDRPVVPAGAAPVQSLGDAILSSDSFKRMRDQGERTSAPIDIKSFGPYIGNKALMSGSAPDFPRPAERMAGLASDPAAPARLRSIIPTVPMQSGSVEFVRETGFMELATNFGAAGEAIGQTVLSVVSTSGFYSGQTVQLVNTSTGATETRNVSSVDSANSTITVDSATTAAYTASDAIISDTFAFTPEASLKPTANATFTLITEPAKTLAHWMPASRQILDDAEGLRAHVDQRLVEGLVLAEETQLLYGNGGPDQINGILTNPDIGGYTPTAPETRLDSLRKAMTFCALAHMPADAIVLHPSDWEAIELSKDAQDRYLWAGAPGSGAGMSVWRVPVVLTSAISAGTALVGNFRMGCAIHDRENANVRVSESHDNYFAKNMVAILAEERLALCVYRPPAFCEVTFDPIP